MSESEKFFIYLIFGKKFNTYREFITSGRGSPGRMIEHCIIAVVRLWYERFPESVCQRKCCAACPGRGAEGGRDYP